MFIESNTLVKVTNVVECVGSEMDGHSHPNRESVAYNEDR